MPPLEKLPSNIPLIALDFETGLESGTPSVEFYRPDFRALSCALVWDSGSLYVEGEAQILPILRQLSDDRTKVVVHNLQFELGVVLARFGDLPICWHADTMRLAQVMDGGGAKNSPLRGYSLIKVAKRFLPRYRDHKEPFYEKIREIGGVKKGKEGAHLHLLSDELFREYNIEDARVTLELYRTMAKLAQSDQYDWSFDHRFYTNLVRNIALSHYMGVVVDREALAKSISDIEQEIEDTKALFNTTFATPIAAIEERKLRQLLSQYKTDRGRASAALRIESRGLHRFNLNSVKDKEELFCTQLGISPKVLTPSGKPSFSRHFLRQWGDGGRLIEKRGTLLILLKQCEAVYEKSAYDGLWHIDLKAVGATTGRNAGTGGINVQGLSRKEPRLMRCIAARPDHTFVSIDLSAGEPTVTTHYSKDKMYRLATFDHVGKEPYYLDDTLVIDDIYLMGMSVSPIGAKVLRSIFDTYRDEHGSFVESWVRDPDKVKTFLKNQRAFHKILILGLGYGMGPKKMVVSAAKANHQLELKDAKRFFTNYWELFHGVKALGDRLSSQYRESGLLVNDFGFRLHPDKDYKALNYFIQSTVSGIMAALCWKYGVVCPKARFVTVIHDELIYEIPTADLPEAKVLWQAAVKSLNEDLAWDVNIRTGWAEGRTFYEAK